MDFTPGGMKFPDDKSHINSGFKTLKNTEK